MAPRSRLRILLFGHDKESSERATRRYLEDINSASCLSHLDKALDQLLHGIKDVQKVFSNYATTNPSGKRVWNRESFARYINARLPENPVVTTCVPLLWSTFCIGAYFPFSVPSNEPEIDVKAFRRAFAFIVLRGYELLGAKSNGQPSPRSSEKFYTDKVPRLARIIFRSLSTPWPQSETQSQGSFQLQDIKDTITFTQPIIIEDMRFGRASVADEEFEAAAYRLLLADHKQLIAKGSSIAVSKADLQILIRLFLLQHAEDRRWRAGLSYYDLYQRSGDIMFSHLIISPDEVSRASELASAFLAYQFPGDDDYVTVEQFKACCSECPLFIFSFFQLWATIFILPTAPQAPRAKDKSTLLISTTNILSFLNAAHFHSRGSANDRFHQNEYLFQLDLQASTLAVNLAATPELSVEKLHKIIAALDWFHVMLIRGKHLKAKGKSSSRLIVAFTSPPEMRMWRPEGKFSMEYTWRTSMVQLEPDIAVADSGGMNASVVGEVLELRSHGGAGKEDTRGAHSGFQLHGHDEAQIPSAFEQDGLHQLANADILDQARHHQQSPYYSPLDIDRRVSDDGKIGSSNEVVSLASHFAFTTLDVILSRRGDRNTLSSVHVSLAFLWCLLTAWLTCKRTFPRNGSPRISTHINTCYTY
ncbi:Hypothetical protein PENO1_062170 [Penicillium occitanis (nom. inval.)]|nr:Hypothetical protein PENO1_062170 [Penicillium occitanis (nom. inval.)]PCG98361.1 hypothetical protein PENOC_063630 [Penicillium occitanis (nom. inval.)]